MNDADYKEAEQVYNEIIRLNLARSPAFDDLSVGAFALIYNGYGPDDWSPCVRGLMTWFYRHFKALAGVHDVDFHLSDGTREGWLAATERWRVNGAIMLADRYPLSKPWLLNLRLYAWIKIRASYRALQLASFDSWIDAYQRRVK